MTMIAGSGETAGVSGELGDQNGELGDRTRGHGDRKRGHGDGTARCRRFARGRDEEVADQGSRRACGDRNISTSR